MPRAKSASDRHSHCGYRERLSRNMDPPPPDDRTHAATPNSDVIIADLRGFKRTHFSRIGRKGNAGCAALGPLSEPGLSSHVTLAVMRFQIDHDMIFNQSAFSDERSRDAEKSLTRVEKEPGSLWLCPRCDYAGGRGFGADSRETYAATYTPRPYTKRRRPVSGATPQLRSVAPPGSNQDSPDPESSWETP
jgi:hypothetical protein